MILASVLSSLLLASCVSAAPTTTDALRFPPADPNAILCKFPFISHRLCPRKGTDASPTVKTVLGTATGTAGSVANRFAVQYATASRWAQSKVATTWKLPNGASDPTVLPLACPQPGLDSSAYSEDCLSLLLYVPNNPAPPTTTGAPVLVWVHGGSFLVGSATGAGLDGSQLASATNSIVAVIQYRLGALGFMAPDGKTNLAVNDVINALKFLKTTVPAFGGDPSKITLAGQSSGADMIRALLAAPSASSLFKSASLHSAPIDYGFLTPTVQTKLLTFFKNQTSCGTTDYACFNSMSVDDILNAGMTLFFGALSVDPSATQAEPMRPVHDGVLITTSLDSTNTMPSTTKPLMLSTLNNDAGQAIYGNNLQPLPESNFFPACVDALGTDRSDTVVQSPFYPAIVLLDGTIDSRMQLEKLGTDYIWKCAAWTFARNWVSGGGNAFVGVYTVGATYPDNEGIPFCLEDGSVCHEDDIMIVFGTAQNPTPVQTALITEVQARYKAFLTTGNPNAPGLPTWNPATTSDVRALNLGGGAAIPVGACDPSFWGDAVQYDYQFFGA